MNSISTPLCLDLAQVLHFNVNELSFFYQPPEDNNIYHVTFKMILSDFDDDYDFEFFFQNHHIKCKLLSRSLIVNILNKEIYGIDFNPDDLKHKHSLTTHQKYNLDLSLKQMLFSRDQILSYHHPSDSRIASPQGSMNMDVSAHIQTIQSIQDDQPIQHLNEFRFFYHSPDDDNCYHVICKIILQDYPQINDENYDFEFFYQNSNDSNIRYHVTCKLLSNSLIINLLNKKIYGRDFDSNEFKSKYLLLNSLQKLNLELNLKQILHFYLCIPSDSNENR
ncbi:hypothetical protein C1645_243103 [Glomus cerebriforme]|uniref:Uncharacterized protein n=1 Tax=Glomus cerebriforme TaxID=658196 RepID=A0A397T0B8_9GLOM|nr:hypothetical protein C1645_243103 [Glomus cerebriforme]